MSNLEKTYWPYIICAYVSLLAFGFIDNIRGPFFPEIISSLDLTASKAAMFFAVTSFMGFVTSHMTPFLLRRFPPLVLMRIALLLMSAAFFWFGFVSNYEELMFGSFLFGVGFGVNAVIHNYAVQVGARHQDRQRLFSGLHANFALASILAPLVASFISGWTWNEVFMAFSAIPFVVFIGTFLAKDLPPESAESRKAKLSKSNFWHAMFFAVLFSLYLWGELSIATRFVLYCKTVLGMGHQEANMQLVYFFVGLLLGRVITAKYQPPISAIHLLLIFLVLSGVTYALGLMYSPLLVGLSGFFMAPCFPLYMEYLSQRFKNLSGNAMALSMGVSSLGVVIMHSVLGLLTDRFGLQTALFVGPISLIVLAIGMFGHHQFFKNKELV